MDGGNGISSDSDSESAANLEERNRVDVDAGRRKSNLVSSPSSKVKEDTSEKSKMEDPVVDSGDEYISDSSSAEDEHKKEDSTEKQEKEESILILPSHKPKDKPFILNGMKITVRKKSSHKKSHRTLSNVC